MFKRLLAATEMVDICDAPVLTPIKQLGPKIDRFRSRRYC